MTKTEFMDLAQNWPSKTSFVLLDGTWTLIGKYCRIEIVEANGGAKYPDVWVCNHRDMQTPLGKRRLMRIKRLFDDLSTPRSEFKVLDGEGWVRLEDLSEIELFGPRLGIHKRPVRTEWNVGNLRKYG